MVQHIEHGHSKLLDAIHWAYDRAISGVRGLDSAVALAEKYRGKTDTLHDDANALIRWQMARAGTSGFITGLGGLLSIPVAIPANLAAVLFLQLRMVAAIAHLAELDVKDERVRSLCFVCLCGQSSEDLLRQLGLELGQKLGKAALRKVSGKVVGQIQQSVGGRLMTQAGHKGALHLHRVIPILGGLVCGATDALATKAIGHAARDSFLGALDADPSSSATPS